jgi:hypothetical protein
VNISPIRSRRVRTCLNKKRPHGLARDEAMSDPRPLLSVSEASAFLVMEADARSAANAVLGWADAGLTVRTVRGRNAAQFFADL